ncbi:YnfE family protein [Aciduricibacillus chroicocephali]|uniref:YnfE family protein n=1 Tax=Aciduricibacillus chroicocephali TaxID=3054939 RepID=A0ABY9KZM9_9BACI|nr:YnfE family protein [Bacillaceae bacterium 44XB]
MERDQIWDYVMAIRNNVIRSMDPPSDERKEAMLAQRKTVMAFEKQLLKEIDKDEDFESFIKLAIDCALGEYPFDDLVTFYNRICKN